MLHTFSCGSVGGLVISPVWTLVTPWTIAHQVLVSVGFGEACIYICLHAVLCLAAQSCLIFCDPMDCSLPGSSVYGDSPGKNTGVGCHALLQGIFPTQVSKPGLPHCRWILYKLSHQGSPRTLEWVAYPFSRGSSHSRNWIRVSCIAGRFFTSWVPREAHIYVHIYSYWVVWVLYIFWTLICCQIDDLQIFLSDSIGFLFILLIFLLMWNSYSCI